MVDDGLGEGRGHLDFADARVGLGVGEVEVGAGWVVESEVADSEIAQFAGADA